MKILLTGSHGLIGTALIEYLATGEDDSATPLVRRRPEEGEASWDPAKGKVNPADLDGYDALVHLAGVGLGERRWTAREKSKLWNSRVGPTEVLAKALARATNPPPVFVSASAVGFYGNRGDDELTESEPQGKGFLADLCGKWEEATAPAAQAGVRVVNLRSGIVITNRGGIVTKQLPLFKLCLGGRYGSGKQWSSWISLEDEVRAITHIIEHPDISGPVNLASPEPVTNVEYTKALGAVLRRPTPVPSPRWLLKLALGAQITDEMLLAGQRVFPAKLLDSGFEFSDPDIVSTMVRMFAPEQLPTPGPSPEDERATGAGARPDEDEEMIDLVEEENE